MVDRADIARISQLDDESQAVSAALANLDQGGVILSMTISGQAPVPAGAPPPGPGPGGLRMPVTVATAAYPAEMVAAIRAQMQTRLTAINQELGGMGVTGLEPPGATAAAPPSPPPRPGQRPVR